MDLYSLMQSPILTFSIILIAALIIPETLKKYQITSIPFYIVAGIIIGPFGIGLHLGEGLIFLGEIGLLFLVFIAGLEVFETGEVGKKEAYLFSLISAACCFSAGVALGILYGKALFTALLLGTILMSSSIGEIIPMVNATPSVKRRLGGLIFPTIVILDATSIILLGLLIKFDLAPHDQLLFFLGVALFIISTVYLLPKFIARYFNRTSHKPVEGDLKFIIAVMIGVVALGSLIGLHGIVAAFLAGMVLGEFIPSKQSFEKIHGIGHGFLVPVFFIVLGMQLEVGILARGVSNIVFPILLIGTLIGSKLIGGLLYAKLRRLSRRDGITLGMVLWPQLSATIAATAIGFETGLFDQTILVSVVIMALFSTLGTPFMLRFFTRKDEDAVTFRDHTVIAGYGRISAKITHILTGMEVPIVVIDKDATKLQAMEDRPFVTIFGNIASSDVLERAKVRSANLVLLAIDNEHELYVAARKVRELNPECHLIVRIHTTQLYEKLLNEELMDEYIWPEKCSAHDVADKVITKIIEWEREVLERSKSEEPKA